jgi:hypothetical protein
MAPVSSYAYISSPSHFDYGVLVIFAVIIGILILIVVLVSSGIGQRAVDWVTNQWLRLGLCQRPSSPHPPRESLHLPIQTPPPPTPPLSPEPSPPIPIPLPPASLRSFDTFGDPAYRALWRYQQGILGTGHVEGGTQD